MISGDQVASRWRTTRVARARIEIEHSYPSIANREGGGGQPWGCKLTSGWRTKIGGGGQKNSGGQPWGCSFEVADNGWGGGQNY